MHPDLRCICKIAVVVIACVLTASVAVSADLLMLESEQISSLAESGLNLTLVAEGIDRDELAIDVCHVKIHM
jgi:hypothetical protein